MDSRSHKFKGHTDLINGCGWFLLIFFGLPGMGFAVFSPESRTTAVAVVSLSILFAVPCILYRARIIGDSRGFRISKGIGRFRTEDWIPREDIETLVLYGQCVKGGYFFSLWLSLVDDRKYNLATYGVGETALLENVANQVASDTQVPLRKDESYYRCMKQAINPRKAR